MQLIKFNEFSRQWNKCYVYPLRGKKHILSSIFYNTLSPTAKKRWVFTAPTIFEAFLGPEMSRQSPVCSYSCELMKTSTALIVTSQDDPVVSLSVYGLQDGGDGVKGDGANNDALTTFPFASCSCRAASLLSSIKPALPQEGISSWTLFHETALQRQWPWCQLCSKWRLNSPWSGCRQLY